MRAGTHHPSAPQWTLGLSPHTLGRARQCAASSAATTSTFLRLAVPQCPPCTCATAAVIPRAQGHMHASHCTHRWQLRMCELGEHLLLPGFCASCLTAALSSLSARASTTSWQHPTSTSTTHPAQRAPQQLNTAQVGWRHMRHANIWV